MIDDVETEFVLAVVDACSFLSDLSTSSQKARCLRPSVVTDHDVFCLDEREAVDHVSEFRRELK